MKTNLHENIVPALRVWGIREEVIEKLHGGIQCETTVSHGGVTIAVRLTPRTKDPHFLRTGTIRALVVYTNYSRRSGRTTYFERIYLHGDRYAADNVCLLGDSLDATALRMHEARTREAELREAKRKVTEEDTRLAEEIGHSLSRFLAVTVDRTHDGRVMGVRSEDLGNVLVHGDNAAVLSSKLERILTIARE